MLIGITTICCSLLYSIMISIVYFSKKKIKNTENSIYSFMMIINVIGLLLELGCCYFLYNMDVSPLYTIINTFINKLFVIYLLTWEFTFTVYIFFVSFQSKPIFYERIQKNKRKIWLFIIIAYVMMLALVNFLPLYYYNDGTYLYSYGPATNLLYIVGGICIIFDIFCVCKNIKNISSKKYYPLFVLILLMIFVFVLRTINPGLIIINSVFAFVTILMYFTIENPDLQMVNELLRNRELVQNSIDDKSTFLFKMSQEVKEPIANILEDVKHYQNTKDVKRREALFNHIETSANNAYFMVHNVLNISTMDMNHIRLFNTTYHAPKLFEDIKRKAQNQLGDKNLHFLYNVDKSLPENLYGDSLKLKQVLISIIYNAFQYTKKGMVSVDINTIERYDVCRFIISVKDSGIGMGIEQINDILSQKEELSEKELDSLNQLDVDLPAVVKIIKMLGGTLNIKSELGKGSEFIVMIDQRVVAKKEDTVLDNIEEYSDDLNLKKHILLVDDDSIELAKMEQVLKRDYLEIDAILLGKECIDKVKAGEKYDLIIMDDEMKPDNAYMIMQELKKIKKFHTPVIIMLDKKKDFIKDHYLKDGFKDYLFKEDFEQDIESIIKKYLG